MFRTLNYLSPESRAATSRVGGGGGVVGGGGQEHLSVTTMSHKAKCGKYGWAQPFKTLIIYRHYVWPINGKSLKQ